MAAVWLDGAKPVCIHPGGPLLRGKESVLQSWAEIFSGAEPPIVEHRLIDRFASERLVIHLVEEIIRSRGASASAGNRVIATNVYLHAGDGWYLAEHHASLPLIRRRGAAGDKRSLH